MSQPRTCGRVPAVSRFASCVLCTLRLLLHCVEVGLVKRVLSLFGGTRRVVCELQVWEEVEGVRQEVREVKGEIKVKGDPHTS